MSTVSLTLSIVKSSFQFLQFVKFHGMVEHGHEARVFMVQNSNVVVTMFDKDYGGRHNERYFKIKV